MKNYKNTENKLFAFDLDCFNEEGQVINEIVEKMIKEKGLIEITSEEAEAIINYKSQEQLVEEERLAKLPTTEELQKNTIELVALGLLAELGVI